MKKQYNPDKNQYFHTVRFAVCDLIDKRRRAPESSCAICVFESYIPDSCKAMPICNSTDENFPAMRKGRNELRNEDKWTDINNPKRVFRKKAEKF